MHEMSLMAGVFDIIAEYTRDLSDKRVTKVKIIVGELTNVVPDALQAAFLAYAQGTVAEGATLDIQEVPLVCRCPECEWAGRIEKFFFICPKCSSVALEIVSGRELRVDTLEVD